MHTDPQSLIGREVAAIDTPALVMDLAILDANLKRMADYFAERNCKIRPHFKSHKCVELARRQLAAGSACGITCAKLSEAERLVAGGIDDVLIANQVVGAGKAARLAELNRTATVRSAVDSIAGIDQLNSAASSCGVTVGVLIEVDIGMGRCGVGPGAPALQLANEVQKRPHLRLDGLQGYEGHLVNVVDESQRRTKTAAAMKLLVDTRRLLEQSGMPTPIVSGGSSSTYDMTGEIDGIDEVQCGSYALMDWKYQQLRPEFLIARWVLATVISGSPGRVVVDVGLKGIGCDFGPPRVEGSPDATARYTAEEHVPIDGLNACVGDQIRLIPSHGCTTNGLHQRMWVEKEGVIQDVWQIEGAGCLE